jgi:hypothetical protein
LSFGLAQKRPEIQPGVRGYVEFLCRLRRNSVDLAGKAPQNKISTQEFFLKLGAPDLRSTSDEGGRSCLPWHADLNRAKNKKRLKRENIVFPKSVVTQVNESTGAAEVPGSSDEPASQTNESGQQRDDDRQKWGWIHHCDDVISNLPIGLT